ncbi:hypothetical protein SLEP1_g43904 [Rubroshorea leprosula]|uniref:Uncharacterized protein n=1 Tax=Rubroshorea leprosula TaxID=152421 RepID=A0AAV5LEI2_9ROSI|nr:hypothetical protein SLEP1_g43904 [Rubroshorea leprosula]
MVKIRGERTEVMVAMVDLQKGEKSSHNFITLWTLSMKYTHVQALCQAPLALI